MPEYNERGLAAAILAKVSDGRSIDPEWRRMMKVLAERYGTHTGVFLNDRKQAYAEPLKAGKEYIWTTKETR